jgi:hypothetical protein
LLGVLSGWRVQPSVVVQLLHQGSKAEIIEVLGWRRPRTVNYVADGANYIAEDDPVMMLDCKK